MDEYLSIGTPTVAVTRMPNMRALIAVSFMVAADLEGRGCRGGSIG